ncbi:serine protease FAM111A-like [Seriola aureovittata]|uniref:serine protease FAM111A-like n=1 Tax=Seriola aureovittata TaxID=2871759 RepID=UPI0024BE2F59|nr:serine protease FAM111A-like [Seriola aureovittata]
METPGQRANVKTDDPGSSSTEKTQQGGATASQNATGSQWKVKEENGFDGEHSHHFTVKFSRHGPKEYTVNCHQPCTVLEAIKSTEKYKEKVKSADANIIIQLGKEDKESIVPTHFPCSCISDDECLIISCKKETIEEAQDQQNKIIYPRDSYIVFFIDTIGGVNAKSKELFRSSVVKQYKTLCVYGEKGMTVEAALKRDGRFIDDLGKFSLSDNENPNILTDCTVTVDNLDQKLLKICLPLIQIQQSFSEVHRVRNLLKLGESVCKLIVKDVCDGTGFVLFDNFILTNAHLFKDYVDVKKLQLGVDVWVLFNYDDPEPDTNFYQFSCEKTFIDFDVELDYAILKLNPEGRSNKQRRNTTKIKVPPGLLKKFGPLPLNGEACIIGHPEGGVKKMDSTCIIEKEKRLKAINDHLQPYTDSKFIIQSIIQVLKAQGTEHILSGGVLAEKVVTYKTFMYRGSSGSPVFDAFGRVFGLHSLIFAYNFGDQPHIVMGCAYPLHIIFKQFVIKLKESGNYELLSRVEEEAKGNKFLEMISPPTPYSEYFRVVRYSSKVCEKSEGKEDC